MSSSFLLMQMLNVQQLMGHSQSIFHMKVTAQNSTNVIVVLLVILIIILLIIARIFFNITNFNCSWTKMSSLQPSIRWKTSFQSWRRSLWLAMECWMRVNKTFIKMCKILKIINKNLIFYSSKSSTKINLPFIGMHF